MMCILDNYRCYDSSPATPYAYTLTQTATASWLVDIWRLSWFSV